MPCAYVLYSLSTLKVYVGSTREATPEARTRSHNFGKVRSTKAGRPWKIVHSECFSGYTEARRREIFLKSGQGRKWIRERFGGVAERLNAAVLKTVRVQALVGSNPTSSES